MSGGRCPASVDGRCDLAIALGARCDGRSGSCAMRREVERQEELAEAIYERIRRAFGVRPDGGPR